MTENNIIDLTPFRAQLTRALARRGERLLAAPDLAAEVAGLEPLEAYFLVKELGLDQALPILRLLSPEQLETCIDLDGWHRYDFSADNLDQWLTAFALDGPEALAQAFFALDYVLQLLFLAKTVTVYDPDTDQVPEIADDEESNRAMTPDGFYLLELKGELPLGGHPFAILDALYQYDPGSTQRLLSEVRVDLPTQIEEEALRFRNGRLQDLGFVAPDEATLLFSRPTSQPPGSRPPEPFESGASRLPAVYAQSFSANTLLAQALMQISDPDTLARLEQEIVWTINSAVIAYGEPSQDIRQVGEIAERVRDTISLGLEVLLAQAEPGRPPLTAAAISQAAAWLELWGMTELFRHGFAATLVLKEEFRQALRQPGFRAWAELVEMEQTDEPAERLERAFVAGLRQIHPLRAGFDPARPETITAFASLAEIEVARTRLRRLVARIAGEGP